MMGMHELYIKRRLFRNGERKLISTVGWKNRVLLVEDDAKQTSGCMLGRFFQQPGETEYRRKQ
jgi:hypothetical protein